MVDAAVAIAAAAEVAVRADNRIQLLHLAVLRVAAEAVAVEAVAAADPTSTRRQLTPESDPAPEEKVLAIPARAMASIDRAEGAEVIDRE